MKRIYSILKEHGAVRLEAFSGNDPDLLIDEMVATTIEQAEDFVFRLHSFDYVYSHIV